jgi:ribosomal protein L37AE/L43A
VGNFTFYFLIWLGFTILSAAILSRYNKAGIGFILGLFLGPLGGLFALLIRNNEEKNEEKKRHQEKLQLLSNINDLLSDIRKTEKTKKETLACPFCAENILLDAKICKHCGNDVSPDKDIPPQTQIKQSNKPIIKEIDDDNYYIILGLKSSASSEEIKKHAQESLKNIEARLKLKDYVFFGLSKASSAEEFTQAAQKKSAKIKEIYAILSLPQKRAKYDEDCRQDRIKQQTEKLKGKLRTDS